MAKDGEGRKNGRMEGWKRGRMGDERVEEGW